MKLLLAELLRKTRQLLEYCGFSPPAWMYRLVHQIKVTVGIVSASNVLLVPSQNILEVSKDKAANQLPSIPQHEQTLDLTQLRSLHGGSPLKPENGIHLMVDLRAAQIHRERGIPRYTQALLNELTKQRPDVRYSWLIEDGEMPLFERSLAKNGKFVRVSDIPLLPRITHYLQSWMFDRSRDARVLFPSPLAEHQPQLAAIFYDMIPWIFPDRYLRNRAIAHGYMRAAELLPMLDRLFAISECSRIDAIAFGCDPQKVTTIYGGWDENRFDAEPAPAPSLPTRYWLYIGGDDPRKNIPVLFQAFAKLRQRMPDPPALVVVCGLAPGRRVELIREAKAAGLDDAGVVVTGYIPDGAMRAIIEGAVATIFPSLYEGLGLPVLESYQFGRPALVSDNSSLKELAPPECRFDASDSEEIAEAVLRFYRNPAVAEASLADAPRILELCSWGTAAERVATWLDSKPTDNSPDEPLDVVSCLPPEESGVAVYSQKTLASAPWSTRFFIPSQEDQVGPAIELMRRARHQMRAITPPPQILSIRQYKPGRSSTVWILGNSEHHVETVDFLFRAGQRQDFVYLHEARLDGLLSAYHQIKKKDAALSENIETLNDLLGVIRPRNILVNSNFCSQLIQSLPNGKAYEVKELFHPVMEIVPKRTKATTRIQGEPLVIMHIGILGESKRPDQIVNACELVHRSTPVRLIFAGYHVKSYLRTFGLERPWVETREGLSDKELATLMQNADVGVQLRWPQHGESSGAVCQWLGLRKPVVCTAGGSFSEFESVAWLVPPESGPENLANAIMQAAQDGVPAGLDDFLSRRTVAVWQKAFHEAVARPGRNGNW